MSQQRPWRISRPVIIKSRGQGFKDYGSIVGRVGSVEWGASGATVLVVGLLAPQSDCKSIGPASGDHLGTTTDLVYATAAMSCLSEITDTE